jgi:hypothetical protein
MIERAKYDVVLDFYFGIILWFGIFEPWLGNLGWLYYTSIHCKVPAGFCAPNTTYNITNATSPQHNKG